MYNCVHVLYMWDVCIIGCEHVCDWLWACMWLDLSPSTDIQFFNFNTSYIYWKFHSKLSCDCFRTYFEKIGLIDFKLWVLKVEKLDVCIDKGFLQICMVTSYLFVCTVIRVFCEDIIINNTLSVISDTYACMCMYTWLSIFWSYTYPVDRMIFIKILYPPNHNVYRHKRCRQKCEAV